jgi:hypothetical protein
MQSLLGRSRLRQKPHELMHQPIILRWAFISMFLLKDYPLIVFLVVPHFLNHVVGNS